MIDATDWNSDGWMDVIAGAANGIVRVYSESRCATEVRDVPLDGVHARGSTSA